MAGATVTVGSLGGVAADFARGQPATVEGMQDPLVAFGYAVDQEASAEAAWRVVVWAFVGEQEAFFDTPTTTSPSWRASSALTTSTKETVMERGRPLPPAASDEERGDRYYVWK